MSTIAIIFGNYYLKKAWRSMLVKKYHKAIKYFDKAIKLAPKYGLAFCGRGLAKAHLGDHKGAMLDEEKAIELNPNCFDAYFHRGGLRNIKGDYADAIKDFTIYIEEFHPNSHEAYFQRGIAKYFLERNEEAYEDLSKAIRLDPHFADAYYQRGIVNMLLHDQEGSKMDIAKAKELGYEE